MKNRFTVRTYAVNIAISLYYSALLVLIIVFGFNSKIDRGFELINKTVFKLSTNMESKKLVFNHSSKRLINYPNYGEKYATLKFDEIDVDLPVYYGDTLRILRNGIGHYASSYFPGEGGTIILAGHYQPHLFGNLYKINKDDLVTIESNYGTFTYKVDEIKVINEKDISAFKVSDNEEKLIMYTCYPLDTIGRKSQRLVVYANLVGDKYEK